MSDITLIFGILLILGAGLPGLMVTWWLLFPHRVAVAEARLAHTPWKTFALGIAGLLAWAVPIFVLFALPGGPPRLLAALAILVALTFATLGAAGMAALMAARLAHRASPDLSPAGRFLRGAAALVLAAGIPVLGWFVVVPVALTASMGAAIFAVLGWAPKEFASQRRPTASGLGESAGGSSIGSAPGRSQESDPSRFAESPSP